MFDELRRGPINQDRGSTMLTMLGSTKMKRYKEQGEKERNQIFYYGILFSIDEKSIEILEGA